jgi:hypothetical protein
MFCNKNSRADYEILFGKEAVVADSILLSQHLLHGPEENYEIGTPR